MPFLLHQLLTETAERFPSRTALRFGDHEMSYVELMERAAQLAGVLVEQGVRREDRVGVYLNKRFESLVAIYGILQAGAAYVPLDPFAPTTRLSQIIRHCGVRHLVSEPSKADRVRQLIAEGAQIEQLIGLELPEMPALPCVSWEQVYQATAAVPATRRGTELDLAYIMYTSGSTGEPKGVMHTHRSIVSMIEWATKTFGLRPDDRVSSLAPYHFALSVFEIFATIGAGATLVQIPEDTVRLPTSLATVIPRERLTVWASVPSTLIQLMQRGGLAAQDLSSLRCLLFSSERFPTKHLRRLMQLLPAAHVCQLFGTTENNWLAFYPVPSLPEDSDEPIPIGRDCGHNELMAVDSEGRAAPAGEVGELVVRGPNLLRGYWGRPDLTEQVFFRYPLPSGDHALFYRTGDLVRLQPDGNYELVGRADRRVKLRGNRIELDEIETVLLSHPQVEQVAVYMVVEGEGYDRIEAAVIPQGGAQITPQELTAHVARQLPAYAVPSAITITEDLPKTSTGKINRRELQLRASQPAAAPQPSAPAEQADVQTIIHHFITQELLGAIATSIDQDQELLGSGLIDSMSVLRLVAFIEETCHIQVPTQDMTIENLRSIRTIVEYIERRKAELGIV